MEINEIIEEIEELKTRLNNLSERITKMDKQLSLVVYESNQNVESINNIIEFMTKQLSFNMSISNRLDVHGARLFPGVNYSRDSFNEVQNEHKY